MIFESIELVLIRPALSAILYAGVFSCGVAYTLQIVAQKNSQPTVASIIMSLEAVFAAIGGALILSQMLSLRETQGSILMLASVFYVQYLENKENKKSRKLSVDNDEYSSVRDETEY